MLLSWDRETPNIVVLADFVVSEVVTTVVLELLTEGSGCLLFYGYFGGAGGF